MKRNIVSKRLLSERILNKVVYPPRFETEYVPPVTPRNLEKFIRGGTFPPQVVDAADPGVEPCVHVFFPGPDTVEETPSLPPELAASQTLLEESEEDAELDEFKEGTSESSGVNVLDDLASKLKIAMDSVLPDVEETPKPKFVVVFERIYELKDGTLERSVDTEMVVETCNTMVAKMNLDGYLHVMHEFIKGYDDEGLSFFDDFRFKFYPEPLDEFLGFVFSYLLDKVSKGVVHGICSNSEFPDCICRQTKFRTLLQYDHSREQAHELNNERLLDYFVVHYTKQYWDSAMRVYLQVPCSETKDND